MGALFGGLFAVLLLVGIAFGTSGLLFPVLIVIAVAIVAAGIAVIRAGGRSGRPQPNPARDAAPASGEGAAAAPRTQGGPDPSGVR
jgi:hypothetical protein